MPEFKVEAQARTQEGIITLGSIVGYDTNKIPVSLDDIIKIVGEAHSHIAARELPTIPARVFEGYLIGRVDNSEYKEPIFEIKLATSPRKNQISHDKFRESLEAYVTYFGNKLDQERIYVQIDGQTKVYKHTDF